MRSLAKVALPYGLGICLHSATRPLGLSTATLPHFQHQTTPRPPASEWLEWQMRRPLPTNPENSLGAKDLELHLTLLMRVLRFKRILGVGAP